VLDEKDCKELSKLRFENAINTLEDANDLMALGRYKGTINRTYYAVLYSVRAVIAFDGTDSKRHKTIMAHFNKEYVHKGLFPSEFGNLLERFRRLEKRMIMMTSLLPQKKKLKGNWEQQSLL
jgi:uncharacterized protein (UPF0332 family)